MIGPLVTHEVIRGDQVPHSTAEAKFKAKSAAKGWRPHRPSWPDFLVETDSGTIAVEVKARSDDLSPEQVATFTVLERAGLPVYIWKDAAGLRGCLVRWAGGGAMDRVSNSGILRGKVEDAVKSLMLAERGQA